MTATTPIHLHISPDEIPKDLFDIVVGYEKIKKIIIKSIISKKPVHILLWGPPASAKSTFVMDIERLPNSRFITGSGSSKAGILDFLSSNPCQFIIIDELDKMSKEDYGGLLSIMEHQRVAQMKVGKTRDIDANIRVYATANRIDTLPSELRSRFQAFYLPPYDEDTFIKTAISVLTKREDTDKELAEYIAKEVWQKMGNHDIRDAVRIARLCSTKEEVDEFIQTAIQFSNKRLHIVHR
jgi:Holliday junction DNA helicase RuvB